MTKKNFFETELNVHFTMEELILIQVALLEKWYENKKNKRNVSAQKIVEIYKKLNNQKRDYDKILK